MNEEMDRMLDEALRDCLKRAKTLNSQSQSKEREAEIRNLTELVKARNELMKPDIEWDTHEADNALKQKQLVAERWERWLRFGLGIVEIGLPLAFYGAWAKGFMRFEKEGHIPSSPAFRNFIREVHPKK